MKINVKGVSEKPVGKPFPAFYQATKEEGDKPEDALIMWALDRSTGVIMKNTFETDTEGKLDKDHDFLDKELWERMPAGVSIEIVQE
ncbi:hypothetical protein vBAbaMD22_120 [Acinetobacter phage vB_AbaM_D22]|nr:hypothetical protein vBAbaMD22_120 [Acinetobacter phage vB_AbaM_D22]